MTVFKRRVRLCILITHRKNHRRESSWFARTTGRKKNLCFSVKPFQGQVRTGTRSGGETRRMNCSEGFKGVHHEISSDDMRKLCVMRGVLK